MDFLSAISVGVQVVENCKPVTVTFDGISGTFTGVFDQEDKRLDQFDGGFTTFLGGNLVLRKEQFTGAKPTEKKLLKFSDGRRYQIDTVAEDEVNYTLTLKNSRIK